MESVVNCARNELRREILIDLLEGQEDCDVIFHLKDQVVVKGHSYILSGELFLRKTRTFYFNS